MPHQMYESLYIHIPFCKSRCNYCDFTTSAADAASPEIEAYTEYLISEIRRLGKEGELSGIRTVYIGGGTPTFIGNRHLTSLLYAISLTLDMAKVEEFTVEANPESLDCRLVNDMWALGANRLSIGIQSLDDGLLKALGRAHNAADAQRAVEAAAGRFDNISVDVMCAIPGQTSAMFENTVRGLLEFPIKHISVYPLTVEAGTPFARMLDKGRLQLPGEDEQADMMELAESLITDAGFSRYEVASYALPGYQSRHNISYWTGVPYIGIGKSAATMTQNSERRMRVQDGCVTDDLNAAQMAAEDAMLMMRMSCGIGDAFVDDRKSVIPSLPDTLDILAGRGLVTHSDGRWMPTHEGWLCGNELYGALLECAPF